MYSSYKKYNIHEKPEHNIFVTKINSPVGRKNMRIANTPIARRCNTFSDSIVEMSPLVWQSESFLNSLPNKVA